MTLEKNQFEQIAKNKGSIEADELLEAKINGAFKEYQDEGYVSRPGFAELLHDIIKEYQQFTKKTEVI